VAGNSAGVDHPSIVDCTDSANWREPRLAGFARAAASETAHPALDDAEPGAVHVEIRFPTEHNEAAVANTGPAGVVREMEPVGEPVVGSEVFQA
jgi:hypothetical protein